MIQREVTTWAQLPQTTMKSYKTSRDQIGHNCQLAHSLPALSSSLVKRVKGEMRKRFSVCVCAGVRDCEEERKKNVYGIQMLKEQCKREEK